jgi:hypothetical protein
MNPRDRAYGIGAELIRTASIRLPYCSMPLLVACVTPYI